MSTLKYVAARLYSYRSKTIQCHCPEPVRGKIELAKKDLAEMATDALGCGRRGERFVILEIVDELNVNVSTSFKSDAA